MNEFNQNYSNYDLFSTNSFQYQQQVDTNCYYAEHQNLVSSSVDQLPFVQIHTTHVEPSPENFHSSRIYRKPQSEIKSEEPIKSEQNDNHNDRVSRNSTPTTSTTPTVTNSSTSNKLPLSVFKCSRCPFLSIFQENLQKHEFQKHSSNESSNTALLTVVCPGCSNVFHSKISFDSHLQNDHEMEVNERNLLVTDLFPEITISEEQPRIPPKQKISIKSVDVLCEPQNRPKIYIKNVDILKKPLFDIPLIPNNSYIEQPLDSLPFLNEPMGFTGFPEEPLPPIKPKSKIYLKDASEILEQPQILEERRATNYIHLRTVDEVNLMNRDDVDNLMAPTDDGLWSHFEDLGNEIQEISEEPQKETHYDLNTPEVLLAPCEPAQTDDDPEILFVCAEEIINANPPVSDTNFVLEEPVEFPEETTFVEDETQEVPEKGRIYVSENLMAEKSSKKINRPRAINNFSKMKKMFGTTIEETVKCDVAGCGFRFKNPETLDYHKKCHSDKLNKIICPECNSEDLSNWNTLHTHLWRTHSIDMELYSCHLCKFKTPIYSRLTNTHMKIHSEERNYQCDQCVKAFKNSKQLKNHRRLHRTNNFTTQIFKCEDCRSAFSHLKSLKAHSCKSGDDSKVKEVKCTICDKILSSKSACKLHMLTHESASKFKCENCSYVTNDHNAFRRHKLQHDGINGKMYECQFCDARIIQSTSFQKHIQQQHPEHADKIILKCTSCPFTTISKNLLNVHIAKHSGNVGGNSEDAAYEDETQETEQPQRNKIKVKSDLVLTDPSKFQNGAMNSSILLHNLNEGIT